MYIKRSSWPRDLLVVASVVLLVLAACGVGDADPNLFYLAIAAFFASFLTLP